MPAFPSLTLIAWIAVADLTALGTFISHSDTAKAEVRKVSRLQPNNARLYRKGVEAFEAKKFEDAADTFTQILQKQPDNTPSKVFLARSLYQLKRMPEAFKLFQQLELNVLDPEPSYEYGQTALKLNDFSGALKAFRNVPNGHPLFDLAGYYGGFCALKVGDYQLALDLLEQAVVLPSKLIKTQKLYQKEAERLLMQKQRDEVQTPREQTPQPPVPTPPAPPQTPVPNPPEDDPKADRVYRFLRSERSLDLSSRYSTQEQSLASKAVQKHEIKEGALTVHAGLDRLVSSNRSAHYLLQGTVSVKGIEGETGRILIMPDAREEQEQSLLNKSPTHALTYGELKGAVEWPIADGNTLGFELGLYAHSANDPGGLTATSPFVNLFLAQRSQAVETVLSFSSHARMLDGEMLVIDSREQVDVSFHAPAHIQLGIQGELQEFAYNKNSVDGPDWLGRIRAELGYRREKELELFVGALFETGQGYRLHKIGDTEVIGFDPTNLGGYARGEVELFNGLRLGAIYQTFERSYSALTPAVPATQTALKEHYPETIQNFSGFLQYAYKF